MNSGVKKSITFPVPILMLLALLLASQSAIDSTDLTDVTLVGDDTYGDED